MWKKLKTLRGARNRFGCGDSGIADLQPSSIKYQLPERNIESELLSIWR
jgi:hypothetical protein